MIKIRPAVIEDSAQIAQVHIESWRHAYRGIVHQSYIDNGLDVDEREERWKRTLAHPNPNYEIFVAEENGKIYGLADIGECRSNDKEKAAEIYAIYIGPDHHRKGIGTMLFSACTEKAKELGYHHLIVWMLKSNTRGQKFYKTMGGSLASGTNTKERDIDGQLYPMICYEWDLK